MKSVDSVVNNIFSRYDKNHNGNIELRNYYNSYNDEGSVDVRTVNHGYSQDVITVTRHSQEQLFRKADVNNDGNVSKYELRRYVENYDRNFNGYLDDRNSWDNNSYNSEEASFNRENRETSYVVSNHVVNHPQPNYPGYPTQPPYYPGHPGYPHQPHYPNYPHQQPHHPNYPHQPHHNNNHHNNHNKHSNGLSFEFNFKL